MRFSFFSALLLCCLATPLRADTFIWGNNSTGNFDDKDNWQEQQVPTAGDSVIFDGSLVTSQHTIVFSGNTTAATEAEADMCTTIFQLTGGYTTGPFTPNSGGGLVKLTGGTMNAQSVAGLDLLISGATLMVSGSAGPSTCTVDGSQSSLQCGALQAGTFIVSDSGSATCSSIAPVGGGFFTVESGGTLTVNGSASPEQLQITGGGMTTADTLTCPVVSVDGLGSSLQLNGAFAPGGGPGFLTELTVTNGAIFTTATVDVTNHLSGAVTGMGSLWNDTGSLYLGKNVIFSVQAGGQFSVNGTMTVDANPLKVLGTNSILSGSSIFLGASGTASASIDVSQGAQLQSGSAFLGDNPAAPASVSVHDPGSSWITENAGLAVGAAGVGTLTVSNAGFVQVQGSPGMADTLVVGFGTGDGGTVNIQDSGSLLDAGTGTVAVGDTSPGQINIMTHAVLDAGAMTIGTNAVTGIVKEFTSGALNLSGDLSIDNGQLQLFSGAQASMTKSGHLSVGDLNGETGSLTVNGVGTRFNNAGQMIVGTAGSGLLVVTNGGELDVDFAGVGSLPGTGTVTVTGTGSVLRVTTFLAAGGTGALKSPGLIVVTNNGLAQVDHQLKVTALGTVNVMGGSINVGSSNAVPPGILRVSAGGDFQNAGTVNGKILVGLGGSFSAGHADGTSLINGDFELDSGGALSMNLSGTNSSTGYDVLQASGNVSLAGSLVLNFVDGFSPRAGQSFTFLKFGSLNGSFSQVQVGGLASGFQYQIQTNNNALVLVASNDGVATSPPLLSLTTSGGNVSISWPATAAGFTLQSSTNLGSTNWTSISTTTNLFITPASGNARFFRLFKPGS